MWVLNRNTEVPELFHRWSRLRRLRPATTEAGAMALINLRKSISVAIVTAAFRGSLRRTWTLVGYLGAKLTKSL
jgi:hypothetical protein